MMTVISGCRVVFDWSNGHSIVLNDRARRNLRSDWSDRRKKAKPGRQKHTRRRVRGRQPRGRSVRQRDFRSRQHDFDPLAASRAIYDYRKDQRLHIAGERIEHADGRRELLIP
ncbi:hypothetical protein [Burkholderia sp. RS02]|uniref:hypothetical protein n=1 Tax=unclassified Burkholderia TaxID=2613784 RepID=UPI00321823B5